MPSCKRTQVARSLASLTRGLGVAAGITTLAGAAGCSSDRPRFNLVGSDFFGTGSASRPAASPVGYAPASYGPPGYAPPGSAPPRRGYYPGAHGNGLQETPLAPVASGQDYYRPPGRDYPPSGAPPYPPPRPEPMAKAPDHGSQPWTDRSPPPWTDKDPFPWPESSVGKQRFAPAESPEGWQGRHVLQSGESLYAIARRYKVGVDELKRVNGITDSSKIWAGKVLAVPGRASTTPTVAAPAPSPATPPRVVQVTPRVVT